VAPSSKNKLFFFGGYQGTIQRSDPQQNIAYVPTPALLAGDFTTLAGTAVPGKASSRLPHLRDS